MIGFSLRCVSESLCSPDLSTADPALLTRGVWTGLLAVSLISCSCCAAGLCGDRLSSSMILTSAEIGPGTGGGGGSLSVKPSLGLGLLDTVPQNTVKISKRNSNIVISYLHFYSILPGAVMLQKWKKKIALYYGSQMMSKPKLACVDHWFDPTCNVTGEGKM